MMLVLLVMAALTISLGATWAVWDTQAARQVEEDGHEEGAHVEMFQVTETMASLFVFAASAFLLVLFFLADYVSYIIIGVFSLGAVSGVYQTLQTVLPLVSRRCPRLQSVVSQLTLLLVSLVPALTWLLCRHLMWAWALQDVLGVLFLVVMLRSVRLPSLRVAAILLSAAFLYDIFWVFLQPHLTQSESVMIHVAGGGDKREPLPLALKVPLFSHNGDHVFDFNRFSILGYGDVVLPGMLCVLMKQFDVFTFPRPARCGYFTWCLVGYVVGMLLTFLALFYNVGGRSGQPALLYLVPCTLGSTLLIARWRGELGAMWMGRGVEGDVKKEDEEEREGSEVCELESRHQTESETQAFLNA